jgi:hypothetical protein
MIEDVKIDENILRAKYRIWYLLYSKRDREIKDEDIIGLIAEKMEVLKTKRSIP